MNIDLSTVNLSDLLLLLILVLNGVYEELKRRRPASGAQDEQIAAIVAQVVKAMEK